MSTTHLRIVCCLCVVFVCFNSSKSLAERKGDDNTLQSILISSKNSGWWIRMETSGSARIAFGATVDRSVMTKSGIYDLDQVLRELSADALQEIPQGLPACRVSSRRVHVEQPSIFYTTNITLVIALFQQGLNNRSHTYNVAYFDEILSERPFTNEFNRPSYKAPITRQQRRALENEGVSSGGSQ